MGAIVGKPRRYMQGMQPSEYWEEIAWPENRETLEVLRFTHDQALVVFKAFVAVDRDNSGEMSVEEFHEYLGVPQTKFSERVFGILDLDGSGALDFGEFAVGVWNYCTYDVRLIVKLAFDIFDVDRQGVLDLYECDALLRMVYDVENIEEIEGPPTGKEILAEMDVNGDGDVTIDEFSDLMESHMYILAPAFDLQRALRQRLLGVKHWEGETRVRQVIFAEYDSLANDSWDSIREILNKRQKEREANAAADAEKKEVEARDELQKHMEHSTLIHRERQMRRKRKLEAAAADQTPQDLAEQAAATELAEACAEMDKPYTYAELRDRLKSRKHLYDCFTTSQHAAAAARVARQEFAMHRATVEDAVTMVEEILKTKEGKQRLKFQMQLYYGKTLFESWTDGNKLQASIAPMFKGADEESVTMATAIKMMMAKRSDLSAAREHARNVLLEENKEECKVKAEAAVAASTAESIKAYAKAEDDLIGIYGGPDTKWEKLLDANADQPFWYHTESGNTLWEEPAVCHVCDEIIDPVDVRCFSCNTDRSRRNRKLYQGASSLPKLGDDAIGGGDEEEAEEDDDDDGD